MINVFMKLATSGNPIDILCLSLIIITIIQLIMWIIFMLKYKSKIDKMSTQVTNIENSFVNFLMELEAKNERLKNKNDELKGASIKPKKSA